MLASVPGKNIKRRHQLGTIVCHRAISPCHTRSATYKSHNTNLISQYQLHTEPIKTCIEKNRLYNLTLSIGIKNAQTLTSHAPPSLISPPTPLRLHHPNHNYQTSTHTHTTTPSSTDTSSYHPHPPPQAAPPAPQAFESVPRPAST